MYYAMAAMVQREASAAPHVHASSAVQHGEPRSTLAKIRAKLFHSFPNWQSKSYSAK